MRIVLASALFLLVAASASAGSAGPYVVLNDVFYARPSFTFEVVSGAANSYIGHSHWRTWSSAGATGRTTLFTNTCRPSCGEGSYSEQAAQVHLFNVTSCGGKAVFSEFEITAASGARLLSRQLPRARVPGPDAAG